VYDNLEQLQVEMDGLSSLLCESIGDTNVSIVGRDCVISESSGQKYFFKLTTSGEEQYRGEAKSLELLSKAAPGLSPKPISCRKTDRGLLFVSEYIDLGGCLTSVDFGILAKRLALEVHQCRSKDGYGFSIPTCCGATRIEHKWFATWSECYSSMIGDLLSQLQSRGRYHNLCNKGEELRERAIPALLSSLSIQPILVHGDLWSGNVGLDRATHKPMVYDPASYFGHNEAE